MNTVKESIFMANVRCQDVGKRIEKAIETTRVKCCFIKLEFKRL